MPHIVRAASQGTIVDKVEKVSLYLQLIGFGLRYKNFKQVDCCKKYKYKKKAFSFSKLYQ